MPDDRPTPTAWNAACSCQYCKGGTECRPFCQCILECSGLIEIVTAVLTRGKDILHHLFNIMRMWCVVMKLDTRATNMEFYYNSYYHNSMSKFENLTVIVFDIKNTAKRNMSSAMCASSMYSRLCMKMLILLFVRACAMPRMLYLSYGIIPFPVLTPVIISG